MAKFEIITAGGRRRGSLLFLIAAWLTIAGSAARAIDVPGVITEDTSLLDTSEPYLVSHVEILPDVTLTIGPGVTVTAVSSPSSIQVRGTLDIQGTTSAKTIFNDVIIFPRATGFDATGRRQSYQINIDNAVFEGGGAHGIIIGESVHGSLRLTNSILVGTEPLHLMYPVREALIEGNVFENAGGISVATEHADVVIRRNRFSNQQGFDGARLYAVENYSNGYSCDVECIPSATVVEQNDFLSTSLVALSVLQNGFNLLGKNNWWGTVDESVIQDMIRDNSDDSRLPSIEYSPFAEQPFTLPMFGDVPEEHWAYEFIETLAANGITSGCGGGNYCPDDTVSRAQMAVFLERGMNGGNYSPPAASGNVFLDVPANSFGAGFIEQLAADGITAGCGNNNFCPDATVTRAQMAVFLLRAKHGAGFSPPAPTGAFGDVDLSYWAAAWIEQLAAEGITSGCGDGDYCPEAQVTRDQMAVFLVRAFGLQPAE